MPVLKPKLGAMLRAFCRERLFCMVQMPRRAMVSAVFGSQSAMDFPFGDFTFFKLYSDVLAREDARAKSGMAARCPCRMSKKTP